MARHEGDRRRYVDVEAVRRVQRRLAHWLFAEDDDGPLWSYYFAGVIGWVLMCAMILATT